MVTPKQWHFLLGFSDGQLVAEVFRHWNGHALAILQERQYQDRVFLEEFMNTPLREDRLLVALEVYERYQERKYSLRLAHSRFRRKRK